MPSLHVSMCLHQADGRPLITPLSRRGMVVHVMQGASGRDASWTVASENDHFCVPACWADHESAHNHCITPCSGQYSRLHAMVPFLCMKAANGQPA